MLCHAHHLNLLTNLIQCFFMHLLSYEMKECCLPQPCPMAASSKFYTLLILKISYLHITEGDKPETIKEWQNGDRRAEQLVVISTYNTYNGV